MQMFAHKQHHPQTPVTSNLAPPGVAPSGQHHRARLMRHLQRTLGNQAVQRILQRQAEERKAGDSVTHDAPALRVPEHPPSQELAPQVRQKTSPALISRKIKSDPQASLSGFFSRKGISNVKEANSVYDHARGGAVNFEQEILIDMLASPRIFHVDGNNNADAAANLNAHVKARTGIVRFASQKKYRFAALSNWSMNPQYYDWDTSKGTWKMKPNADKQTAWDDLNLNPQLYAIGCAAATDLTMKGGSKGANIIDKPSGDTSDWIPGDAGYIENASYQSNQSIGLMGENIIYTGNGQFWGHFTSSVTFRTLAEWIAEVESWTQGGGTASVDNKRELPATGLLDT